MSDQVLERFEGGCHCGEVRVEVRVPERVAIECNCSICTMKGFLHVIVPEAEFTLLRGKDALSTYRFGTGKAAHHFCTKCGIHSFYRPRSHPDGVDVNLRCLPSEIHSSFEIRPFDGRNWEDSIHQLSDFE